jgi:hypothetical protein
MTVVAPSPDTVLAPRVRGFVELVLAHDLHAASHALAPSATLRAVLPARTVEAHGVREVCTEAARWYGEATGTLVAFEAAAVGSRCAFRSLLLFRKGSRAWLMQQTGYADGDEDGITRLDLVCSGAHHVELASVPRV